MTSEWPNWIFYAGNTFSQKPQTNLSQLDEIVAKIHSFEKLAEGWHFGRGSAILGGASVSTQRIAGIGIQNGYDVEIFPGPDQDILIALRKGEDYYEVIANADSTVSYFLETRGVEALSQESRPLEEIEEKLNKDNAFIWSTIASSILLTGTLRSTDSSALHSKTRKDYLEEEESQSSIANVSRVAA